MKSTKYANKSGHSATCLRYFTKYANYNQTCDQIQCATISTLNKQVSFWIFKYLMVLSEMYCTVCDWVKQFVLCVCALNIIAQLYKYYCKPLKLFIIQGTPNIGSRFPHKCKNWKVEELSWESAHTNLPTLISIHVYLGLKKELRRASLLSTRNVLITPVAAQDSC